MPIASIPGMFWTLGWTRVVDGILPGRLAAEQGDSMTWQDLMEQGDLTTKQDLMMS